MSQLLQAVFVHGDNIDREDYTPSGADIACGEVVNLGTRIGICTSPEGIADGQIGSLAVSGVFRLLKDDGAAVTFARDAAVNWDDTNNLAVADGTASSRHAGICVKAATATEDGVWVRINEPLLASP